MAFALALFAASCSQDELPGDGGDTPVTGQTQTYTFTVSPDIVMEGEAGTRTPTATTDDQPTRCFMQVYDAAGVAQVTDPIAGTPSNDNGDYTFTTKLFSNTEYTYLFWADNANVEVADLKAVPYTAGTVAFSYRTKGTPENVAKTLTLQTTTETSAEAGEAVRVTATCASSYNVAAPVTSTFSSQTAEKVFEAATDFTGENPEVASFYFIPRDEEQDVDVEFHLLKQTIESVPSPISMSICKATCRKAIPSGERQENMHRSKSTAFSKMKMVILKATICMMVLTDFIYLQIE